MHYLISGHSAIHIVHIDHSVFGSHALHVVHHQKLIDYFIVTLYILVPCDDYYQLTNDMWVHDLCTFSDGMMGKTH